MRRALLLIVLLGLAATAPRPAQAFIVLKNYNGATERWSSTNVTWTLSTSVMNDVPFADLQAALVAAFKSWQDVACATLTFTNGGQKANDPQNGIHFTFRQNGWDPSVADALAYSVSETSAGGTITSSDIVFNAYDAEWSVTNPPPNGKVDIQGVATHEIGHSLGMDHSRAFTATMFFTGGSSDIRGLEDDDSRGLCFLYPTSSFTTGAPCDACDSDANCAGGTCLDWGGGHAYCGKNCGGAAGACPDGFTCYEIQGVATPQCLPDNDFCHDYGANVKLGGACYGNQMCESGQCLALEEEAYCTKSCNAANAGSCGAGYTCLAPGLCVKSGSSPYGSSCQDSLDCATAQCVFFQFSTGVCTLGCGQNGGSCPNGDRCYEDSACVPPGLLGNGAPCYAPDQCRGMYCESQKCTSKCSGNGQCPTGTTCVGGFCSGSEVGSACSATGACPADLTCQKPSAESAGSCERACDALTDQGCPAGEVCEWRWQAWNEKILGHCIPENGGGGLGASCSSVFCEGNYVCRFQPETGPVCHRDCKTTNGFGCDFSERCVSLDDPADPQHGICVPKEPVVVEPGPEPSPEPVPEEVGEDTATGADTAVSTDTGGTTPGEDVSAGVDTGPVAIGRSAGGCGAGGGGDLGLFGLCGLLGVVGLATARRRARRVPQGR